MSDPAHMYTYYCHLSVTLCCDVICHHVAFVMFWGFFGTEKQSHGGCSVVSMEMWGGHYIHSTLACSL